ncbi:secreted protein [marine sediment metagenome]|uniref:Secreted protein n=1 Tax=marine sediment metagenome TaxID=412755 RepID=A0A1B6NWM6_9ZZZZ
MFLIIIRRIHLVSLSLSSAALKVTASLVTQLIPNQTPFALAPVYKV